MLRAHAPLINQAAARLADRFGHMQQAQPLQINDAVAVMTMEVIGEAFG